MVSAVVIRFRKVDLEVTSAGMCRISCVVHVVAMETETLKTRFLCLCRHCCVVLRGVQPGEPVGVSGP